MNQNSRGISEKDLEPIIGLEIHCQLLTASKLFCSCSTKFGSEPNANTCPVCLGHPGVLPVVNSRAIDFGIAFACAIGGSVQSKSVFSRKQYFYPDLPKGYQITQYDLPYSLGGRIELTSGQVIDITRIHFEEDAGKSIHGDGESFVDLNRAGVPLIEIVSEPVIHSAKDAAEYLRKIRAIVRYLAISDGNLEEGSFRCDANISMRKKGTKTLGARCEIKNLNSFKNVERAINYEISRQSDLMIEGETILQQTLQFDAAIGKTKPMRSKEDAHDYRYFPEPDLKPLIINSERIERVRNELITELPSERKTRFESQYELSSYDAEQLTIEKELADFYESVIFNVGLKKVSSKVIANWILTELLRVLNQNQLKLGDGPLSIASFSELLVLLGEGKISGKIAKTVFDEMLKTGKTASIIVAEKGLTQVSDDKEIKQIVGDILAESPEQVSQYLGGKEKVYSYFVGQIMKRSRGRLNPNLVNSFLDEKLKSFKKDP